MVSRGCRSVWDLFSEPFSGGQVTRSIRCIFFSSPETQQGRRGWDPDLHRSSMVRPCESYTVVPCKASVVGLDSGVYRDIHSVIDDELFFAVCSRNGYNVVLVLGYRYTNFPNKQSDSDPIPTWLPYKRVSVLVPAISQSVSQLRSVPSHSQTIYNISYA